MGRSLDLTWKIARRTPISHYRQNILKANKKSEYRSYLMEDIEQLWFLNTQDKLVTHMAAVEMGQLHKDKRPDGTLKRKWKYPITTFYKLDTPLYPKD